jgi:hypothetical protein
MFSGKSMAIRNAPLPIALANFICLSTGEHQGQEVGGGESRGEGMGGFWDSIGNVSEENT